MVGCNTQKMTLNERERPKTWFPVYMQTVKRVSFGKLFTKEGERKEFSKSSNFSDLKIGLLLDKRPNHTEKAMLAKYHIKDTDGL